MKYLFQILSSILLVLSGGFISPVFAQAIPNRLVPKTGDRIVLLGNTFAELNAALRLF